MKKRVNRFISKPEDFEVRKPTKEEEELIRKALGKKPSNPNEKG